MKAFLVTLTIASIVAVCGYVFIPEADHWVTKQLQTAQEYYGQLTETEEEVATQESVPNPETIAAIDDIWTAQGNYMSRIRHLRENLPTSFNNADLAYLFHTFEENPVIQHQKNLSDLLMNECLEELRIRGAAPKTFSNHLISTLEDETKDVVLRDYCAQHLSLWLYPLDATLPRELDLAKKAQAVSVFYSLLQDGNETAPFQGTLLNCLKESYLSSPDATEEHQAQFRQLLTQKLHSPDVDTQITAINLAGEFQLSSSKGAIQQLANHSTNPAIQLASRHTLQLLSSHSHSQ